MTEYLGKHIIALLKEHECVVIPEFGAFLLQNSSAHISSGKIFSASKKIVFNKYIQTDDGLLSAALVNSEISFTEAKLQLKRFINTLKFELNQKGFYDIEGLGRFTSNQQDVSFVSNGQIENLDKQNFGFENLSIFPVQREIVIPKIETRIKENESIVNPEVKKVVSNTGKTRSIRKSSLIGLAASFLLMFTIGSLMISNTKIDSLQVKNANVLNFLIPAKSAKKVETTHYIRNNNTTFTLNNLSSRQNQHQETAPEKSTEQKEKPASLEILSNNLKANTEKENTATTTSKTEETEDIFKNILQIESDNPIGFYIVIGAYSDLANANKAKYECSLENACSIFKTNSGMYRVGIYTTTEKEIAIDILKEFKKTNASYWLMESL